MKNYRPIKKLTAQLANQIAAGEVVERPASIVKELIENSLDADATQIDIDIEKGGHKRIRIRDNGSGVLKEELALALAPHATSKISQFDDLQNILSMGFRGEALASISAVSRLNLISKPDNQPEAWSAMTQGRDMQIHIEPAAHPNGTSIDVRDLFFNTPARKKFLRAEKTEFQHIENIVKRIALSRPDVSFVLNHNQKCIKRWSASKSDSRLNRIQQICGQQFAQQARFSEIDYHGVRIKAWIGGSNLQRSANDLQYSFVNQRPMRDKLLLHAVRQAYEMSQIDVEHPAFVLFLDIAPCDVDVNVHPAKHEVRFTNSREIHDLVCKVFMEALEECENSSGTKNRGDSIGHHDYHQAIRPLAAVRESHSQTVQSASRAYSQLMSVPQSVEFLEQKSATSQSNDLFFERGALRVLDNNILWLSDENILAAWIEKEIGNSQISQPLLLPVAVKFSADQTSTWFEEATQYHFVFEQNNQKSILREVPSRLRTFPWPKITAELINRAPKNLEALSQCIANILITSNIDEDMPYRDNIAVYWSELTGENKVDLFDKKAKKQSLSEFIDWMASQ